MSGVHRAVCDTNVIISGLLTSGAPAQLLDYFLLGDGYLVFSETTAIELEQVLMREKFDPYLSRARRRDVLREVFLNAEFVTPQKTSVLCRDPKDNAFLDAALAAEAEVLISGDQDLLVLKRIGPTPIVRPMDFLLRFAN